jgi:hypothetical protein
LTLYLKFTLSSLFHMPLFGRKNYIWTTPSEREFCFTSRVKYLRKLFEIFLHKRFFSFPHLLTYVIFYFYLYDHMDIYYTWWALNQYLFILLLKLFQTLAIGSSFCWFLCSFDKRQSMYAFFSWLMDNLITFWYYTVLQTHFVYFPP